MCATSQDRERGPLSCVWARALTLPSLGLSLVICK